MAVEVYGGGGITKEPEQKTVTPKTTVQKVTPTSEDYELKEVTVNAMPSGSLAEIEVSNNGLITGKVGTAGYLSANTSKTKQLPIVAGQSYTPGTADRTIVPTGNYATGNQVMKGDANLVEENIKEGTTIFGKTGTMKPNPGAFENLFRPNPVTVASGNGITFVDNGDGSLTVNGTATAAYAPNVGRMFLKKGTYKLAGSPQFGAYTNGGLSMRKASDGTGIGSYDTGDGTIVTLAEDMEVLIRIVLQPAYGPANNLVFKPIVTTNLDVTYDNWYPKIKSVENLFVLDTVRASTYNGITYTNNGDGTFTLSGTSTSNFGFYIAPMYCEVGKTYKLTCYPKLNNGSFAYAFNDSGEQTPYDYGDGIIFTATEQIYRLSIWLHEGLTIQAVMKPMLTENLSATYDNFVKRVGGFNNLFVPTLATTTTSGVTVTNNGDGTYTLNGTATATVQIPLGTMNFNKGWYKISGDIGGSTSQHFIGVYKSGTIDVQESGISGKTFCIDNVDGVTIRYVAFSGTTFNNAIIKPMVTESLLPEYYDFVKGIEATPGEFASGYFTNITSSYYITIPHNLGKKPKWFFVANMSSSASNMTQSYAYNESWNNTYAYCRYYRGNLSTKSFSTTKNSTTYVYADDEVITLPYASSSYTWGNGTVILWAAGV